MLKSLISYIYGNNVDHYYCITDIRFNKSELYENYSVIFNIQIEFIHDKQSTWLENNLNNLQKTKTKNKVVYDSCLSV